MTSVKIPNGTTWNNQCRPVNMVSTQLLHCSSLERSGSLCVRF
jgi:hypothetical protein